MPHYKNFTVAVYSRVYEIQDMMDERWLTENWAIVESQLKVDKFYVETHRDRITPTDEHIVRVKQFFADRGIETAGGTALVADERSRFETFCYTNQADRDFVQRHIEQTARHFDEIILDDFFFNNTKTDSDIRAKGERSWTDFRLDLMAEVAQDVIIGPARAVNPNVKLVIKYPNWYPHFQGLGFDLEMGPMMFDGIYAGTETRQPKFNAQHLQQYLSYGIIRYFDNLSSGRNGGGWVDTGGMDVVDRYAEQLWLTLFAKTQEITLFDLRQLLIAEKPEWRASWQGCEYQGAIGSGFDYDALDAPHQPYDDSASKRFTVASVAQNALAPLDQFLGELGNPIGVAAYTPFQTSAEDYLHHYFGMIGIPIEMTHEFPTEASVVFLTENAANDPEIVSKIEAQLFGGKRVVMTSGLFQALEGQGIETIVEARVNGRSVLTDEFFKRGAVWKSPTPILLPQIDYLTNDSWLLVGASGNAYPLILQAAYSKGILDIIAIPDNPADLYKLPSEVLSILRSEMCVGMPVRLEGPSGVCLFVYDNDTLIVESFLDDAVDVNLILQSSGKTATDLVTGVGLTVTEIEGGTNGAIESSVKLKIKPHAYVVIKTG